jgi:hypothetical protein
MAAAASLAAISMTGFIGQFLFGWITDRIKYPKYGSFIGISFMLLGTILLLNVRTAFQFYICILSYTDLDMAPSPRYCRFLSPIVSAGMIVGSIYGLLTFFIGVAPSVRF